MAKLNESCKRWSLDRHDVSSEILEDMGVSLLDEDSCGSSVKNESSEQRSELSKRKNCASPVDMNFIDCDTSNDSFSLTKRKRLDGPLGHDSFSKLSDEIVLCIFKWLPKSTIAKCAQVSKRWRRLAYDEVLWKRLDLGSQCLKPTILGNILNRGVQILRLAKTEICEPIYPLPSSLTPFNQSTHNLQYLDLSMASISTDGLCELFQYCRNLKKLSLEHCSLDARVCQEVGQNSHLEILNMSMCYGVSQAALEYIVKGCSKLESWNLAWTDLSISSLDVICTSAPKNLKRINISGCRNTLKDDHVVQLCQRCPDLVELDISDSTCLTSAVVNVIHEQLDKLEYLAMSRCYNVQLSSFLVFQKSELLYLDVFGMLTDSTLQTLRSSLPSIEVNKFYFSSLARPTVGIRRTSIWGLKVRD